MTEQIKMRRDTNAHYATDAPILGQAEPAMEIDAQGTAGVRTKFGDGVTGWASLPFFQEIADGSAAGASVIPPLTPAQGSGNTLTTGATLTNGANASTVSLVGIVPTLPVGTPILVVDGASHYQEFIVSVANAGGTGTSGSPVVVSVTTVTVTLNTGTGYAVVIGGSSFSIGIGVPNDSYGSNRSVYLNVMGTTNAASSSGFNTLYVKQNNHWVGIL